MTFKELQDHLSFAQKWQVKRKAMEETVAVLLPYMIEPSLLTKLSSSDLEILYFTYAPDLGYEYDKQKPFGRLNVSTTHIDTQFWVGDEENWEDNYSNGEELYDNAIALEDPECVAKLNHVLGEWMQKQEKYAQDNYLFC